MYSAEHCDATITAEAYCKINLHGARYASEVVCGFLVGSIQAKGKEAQIYVEDVLPICHNNPVGPIFEVAGAMMKSIFPAKQVVGLYYTSVDGDYGNDESTPYFVDKLCDTIKANSGKDGLCLVLTIAVSKIIPAANVDDVESDDDMSSVLCLNAYMTNTRSDSSSSSKRSSGRERTASFQSTKLSLEAAHGTGHELNAILDQFLLSGKQYSIEDIQSQLAGVPGISPRNQHINLECGLISGKAK